MGTAISIHSALNGMKTHIEHIERVLEGVAVGSLDASYPLYKRIGQQRRQLRELNRNYQTLRRTNDALREENERLRRPQND